MNLVKRGLIQDSSGQIVRPEESAVDWTSTTSHFQATSSKRRAKARTTSKARRRPAQETPQEYQERKKTELGLVDIDQDIREMGLDTLRHHFGYKNKRIQRGLFCRNVVWQILRFTKAGKPPGFVQKGGNVRSLWYYAKALITKHSWSFGEKVNYDGLFSDALTELTNAGLMEYRELNFIDQNRVNRWVAPSYGTKNLIVIAEKRSFSDELLIIGKRYGVTVQATGGVPSRVTIETMLLEMAEAGHELTKPFTVFAMVDFDPAGWNIAQTFVEHMLGLGLKKIKTFSPYGATRPRQTWLDIVSVNDLDVGFVEQNRHRLEVNVRSKALADEWVAATGGLYGRDGKTWALSSEVFLGFVDDHLANKLPQHLDNLERYKKIVAYESLDQPLKNYIAAKLFSQM